MKSSARVKASARDEDASPARSPVAAARPTPASSAQFTIVPREASSDEEEDDDNVPSSVARSWKAKHKLRSLAEELEEDELSPPKKGHRAKHSISQSARDNATTPVAGNGSHTRASSAAAQMHSFGAAATTAPSPVPSPLASPAASSGQGIDPTTLPYAARVEYEANYARRWKVPMTILVDQLLTRYALLPKRPPSPPPRDLLLRSMSAIDTNRSRVPSEDFDADLYQSPGASPLSSSLLMHPAPRHFRSASTSSAASASSPMSASARMERDREEAERHSLAKGKLKIQAALLRRKHLDWQRRVDAGETTWEQLEHQEAEQERKSRERHQEKHREIVSRIIDPRDHSSQRRAEAEANEARLTLQRERSVEWYWNSIPIAAVALMRVLVHNRAFDACLPLSDADAASSGPSLGRASSIGRRGKNSSDALRDAALDATAGAKYELCRTWLLSDVLYAFRTLLIAIVNNEPEPVSPAGIITPRNGHTPAASPSGRTSATVQRTSEQVQARLIWLLNNIVVLLHLTRRLAVQRQEEFVHQAREVTAQGKKSHRYVPRFALPPSEWSTSTPLDFPSANPDGTSEHSPLSQLASDVDAYVFELEYDETSDNTMHWFYCWLLRLARVTSECLLHHIYTHTPLHTLLPSAILHPTELMSLGSDTLDGVIEVLGGVFEATTEASLLNLLKSQLLQALMDQFARGLLQVVLTDPHLTARAAVKHTQQRLLSQAVPLGMRLSMIYSSLEDWSQRCTAFAHPFVQATRLTLAPLKEACLFCLLDEKSDLSTLDAFEVLTPSMPRPLLLALCHAYNALPNNDDQVDERVLKQLRKRIEKDRKAAESQQREAERMRRSGRKGVLASAPSLSPRSPSSSSTSVSASSADATAAPAAMPVLPPFMFSLDLSSQLGKFILAAVELPAQLTSAHPALNFLKNAEDGPVL